MGTIAWNSVEKSVCRVLGSIHIALAIAVLVGGAKRFPTPSYDSILRFSHGQAWPYGMVWLAGGALMMLPSTRWRLVGTGLVVFISSLWAGLFAIAAYEIPTAAFTPVAAYGGYGLLNAITFWTMWWRRRNHGVT